MSEFSLAAVEDLETLQTSALATSLQSDRDLTPLEEMTEAVAQPIFNEMKSPEVVFLNAAMAVVEAGLAYERQASEKLSKFEAESNKNAGLIDHLLELSKEAGALNIENPKITEKMRNLLQQLKEGGISVMDIEPGKEINKDMLSNLKAIVSTQIDKLRTHVQQLFSKMQTEIQQMSSVNDTVKKIINDINDLVRKILDRSIKR